MNAYVNLIVRSPQNLGTVLAQMKSQLQGLNANIKVDAPNIAAATTSLRAIKDGADKVTDSIYKLGEQTGIAAKRFLAYTIAAGGFITFVGTLKEAIGEAVKFQRELVRLAQVSGDTYGTISQLEKEITGLSKTLGVSSKELLAAAVVLKQAGLATQDVQTSLEALAKAALAPNFDDLKSTTEGVVAIMQQFKTGANDLEEQLGSINAVAGAFAVESRDLIDAIKRTGGAFKVAGGDLNELIALFTSVRATTRESAESIATAFRTIFARIQRPETIKELEALGIQLRRTKEEAVSLGDANLEGKFVGPYEAIRRLSIALKNLPTTDTRFASIVEEIGGIRQISKVVPLIQEFETAQKALNVAQSGGISLTVNAKQAQEAYIVQLTKVKEEILALGRSIVQSQGFNYLVTFLATATKNALTLIEAIKPLVPLLTALAAVKLSSSLGAFFNSVGSGFLGRSDTLGRPINRAGGGIVPGTGDGDTVPAYLTPGEYVIRKQSAQAIGYGTLERINKYGQGGVVRAKDGGRGLSLLYLNPNKKGSSEFATIVAPRGKLTEEAREKIGKARKATATMRTVGPSVKAENELGIKFRSSVKTAVSQIANDVFGGNVEKIDDDLVDKVVNPQGQGRIFEAALQAIANTKIVSSNQDFDFPKVPKSIDKIFPGTLGSNGDAKLTDNEEARIKVLSKAIRRYGVEEEETDEPRQKPPKEIDKKYGAISRASGGEVPALLTPGEYVLSKQSAARLGKQNLDKMNQTGELPRYHTGGVVQRFQTGGTPIPASSGIEGFAVITVLAGTMVNLVSSIKETTNAFKALNEASKRVYQIERQERSAVRGLKDTASSRKRAERDIASREVSDTRLVNAGVALDTAKSELKDRTLITTIRRQEGLGLTAAKARAASATPDEIATLEGGINEVDRQKALRAFNKRQATLGLPSFQKIEREAESARKSFESQPDVQRQRDIIERSRNKAQEEAQRLKEARTTLPDAKKYEKEAKKQKFAQLSKTASVAGVTGIAAASVLFEQFGRTKGLSIETAPNEALRNQAVREERIGGALSGAGIGAGIGVAFGPIGVAFGAAAGAALGFAQAVKETNQKLAEVELEKTFTKFQQQLEEFNSGKGGNIASINSITRQVVDASINKTSKQFEQTFVDEGFNRVKAFGSRFLGLISGNTFGDLSATEYDFRPKNQEIADTTLSNIKQQLGLQLPALAEAMNKEIANFAKQITTRTLNEQELNAEVENFKKNFAINNRDILSSISLVKNVPVDKVLNDFVKSFREQAKALSIERGRKDAAIEVNNVLSSINRLAQAFSTASQSVTDLGRSITLVTDKFDSGFTPIAFRNTEEGIRQFGAPNQDAFNQSILDITAQVPNNQLGVLANGLNKAERILPSILSTVLKSSAFGKKNLGIELREQLDANNIPKEITDSIVSKAEGSKPEDIAEKLRESPEKITEELLGDFNPFKKALAEMGRALYDQAGRLNAGLAQGAKQGNLVNSERGKIDNLELSLAKTNALFQARAEGRQGSVTDFLTINQLTRPFQIGQERLTGLKGAEANDPVAISKVIAYNEKKAEEALKRRDSAPVGSEASAKAAAELIQFQNAAANARQALRNLAENADKAAIASEKLNAIEQERGERRSLAKTLLTSDPEQLQRLNLGAKGLLAARQVGIENLPLEIRKAIFELTGQFRNVRSAAFGGATLGEVEEQLVGATNVGKTTDISPEQKAQIEALQQIVQDNNKLQIQAQRELVNNLNQANTNFIKDIEEQFKSFLSKLENSQTEVRRADLQQRKIKTEAAISQIENGGIASKKILSEKFGITTDEQINLIRANQSSFTKLKELNESKSRFDEKEIDNILTKLGPIYNRAGRGIEHYKFDDGGGGGVASQLSLATRNPLLAYIYSKINDKDGRVVISESRKPLLTKQLTEAGIPAEVAGKVLEVFERRFVQGGDKFRESLNNPNNLQKLFRESIAEVFQAESSNLTRQIEAQETEIQQRFTSAGQDDLFNRIKSDPSKITRIIDEAGKIGSSLKDLDTQFQALKKTLEVINGAISKLPPEPEKKAAGGIIFKPHGSDTVPAMLTPGEYVVNARAASKHLGLLNKINSGQDVIYASSGGLIDTSIGMIISINLQEKRRKLKEEEDYLNRRLNKKRITYKRPQARLAAEQDIRFKQAVLGEQNILGNTGLPGFDAFVKSSRQAKGNEFENIAERQAKIERILKFSNTPADKSGQIERAKEIRLLETELYFKDQLAKIGNYRKLEVLGTTDEQIGDKLDSEFSKFLKIKKYEDRLKVIKRLEQRFAILRKRNYNSPSYGFVEAGNELFVSDIVDEIGLGRKNKGQQEVRDENKKGQQVLFIHRKSYPETVEDKIAAIEAKENKLRDEFFKLNKTDREMVSERLKELANKKELYLTLQELQNPYKHRYMLTDDDARDFLGILPEEDIQKKIADLRDYERRLVALSNNENITKPGAKLEQQLATVRNNLSKLTDSKNVRFRTSYYSSGPDEPTTAYITTFDEKGNPDAHLIEQELGPLDVVRNYDRKRFARYASGGVVTGHGAGDKVPALLSAGEYVLNKNAVSRIGTANLHKVNYFAQGGSVPIPTGNGGGGLSSAVDSFNTATATLKSVFDSFIGGTQTLAQAMNNFPRQIEGVFTHRMEVLFNGAEVLTRLQPVMKEVAEEAVYQAISSLKNDFDAQGIRISYPNNTGK
jgi:TP901 family phage tail tape measure protein